MKQRKGQVAMSLVFLIGGIMIIIGATLTFVVVSFLNATFGYRASNQALTIAQAGVDDAILILARNKDFSDSGYCVPSCVAPYSLVAVTQNSPQAGQATIISDAVFSGRERKIRAVVSISDNGQVNMLSWNILSL